MKKSELKPCPFCGGTNLFIHEGFSHECATVRCKDCDIDMHSSEEYEESGTIWNTRAPAPGTVKLTPAERAELLQLADHIRDGGMLGSADLLEKIVARTRKK